ncbi:redox-regulated ATPase YchF [Candidatus Microgenomates bacterium]|nr:redox-regulated ATPase YchF [Candidatus Microgenomates bacterium]
MSLKVGIVGLPNVGKSTLFNALLKKRVALSANYPFATVESNVGIVAVPDNRLQKLAELVANENPKSEALPPIVPAVVEFVDIAGLVRGASQGEGLGNQFLSHIREVDAIIHVIRDFSDPNVIRVGGSTNPKEDKELIETELQLADLDKADKLSTKPVLYVYNVSEEEYGQKLSDRKENVNPDQIGVNSDEIIICAKLEEELADLSEEERKQYLKELGIEETGLERLIKKAYILLGLISFLTAGVKEVRAWTIKNGTLAPEAAGVIHTDFIKNFIRAQVVDYDKLIEAGSYKTAREKGWIRTEGKDYVMRDGDVVEFLVSS